MPSRYLFPNAPNIERGRRRIRLDKQALSAAPTSGAGRLRLPELVEGLVVERAHGVEVLLLLELQEFGLQFLHGLRVAFGVLLRLFLNDLGEFGGFPLRLLGGASGLRRGSTSWPRRRSTSSWYASKKMGFPPTDGGPGFAPCRATLPDPPDCRHQPPVCNPATGGCTSMKPHR